MSGEDLAGFARFLLCMLATGHLDTAVHEGGHWLAGRLAGIPVRELRVGGGREVFARRVGATVVTFGWGPWRGFAEPYLHAPVGTWREILFSAGGSLASLLLACTALALLWSCPDFGDGTRLVVAATLANALGGVAQVFPRLPFGRTKRNDFRAIWDAIRARGREDAWEAWARREYASHVTRRYPVPGGDAPSRLAPIVFHALAVGPPSVRVGWTPTVGLDRAASFAFQRWLLSRRGLSAPERAALLDAVATAALIGEVSTPPSDLDDWTAELVALAPDAPTARGTRGAALVALGRPGSRALLERDPDGDSSAFDRGARRAFIARALLDEGDRDGAASALALAEADLDGAGQGDGFPMLDALRGRLAAPAAGGGGPG